MSGQPCRLRWLSLAGNSLSGTIPSSNGTGAADWAVDWARIGAGLQYVNLADNIGLSGSLPGGFAQMSELVTLNLRNNSFTGTLPNSSGVQPDGDASGFGGNFGALRILRLEHNALSGSLPAALGLARELRDVSIEGNRLSGTLPSQLGRLSRLVKLRLANNNISGTLPVQINAIEALNELDLCVARPNYCPNFGGLTNCSAEPRDHTEPRRHSPAHPKYFALVGRRRYGNPLEGDLPDISSLINLKRLYVPNSLLLPLRRFYCGQRLVDLGKYSYRMVREEYHRMMECPCPQVLTTEQTFGQVYGNVLPANLGAIGVGQIW